MSRFYNSEENLNQPSRDTPGSKSILVRSGYIPDNYRSTKPDPLQLSDRGRFQPHRISVPSSDNTHNTSLTHRKLGGITGSTLRHHPYQVSVNYETTGPITKEGPYNFQPAISQRQSVSSAYQPTHIRPEGNPSLIGTLINTPANHSDSYYVPHYTTVSTGNQAQIQQPYKTTGNGDLSYSGIHSRNNRQSEYSSGNNQDRSFEMNRRPSNSSVGKSIIKENLMQGEPRLVEVRTMEPVSLKDNMIQPMLKGIIHSEHGYNPTMGSNLKKLLLDTFKRIVILGMENDRLNTSNQEKDKTIHELSSKLSDTENQLNQINMQQIDSLQDQSRSASLQKSLNDIVKERNQLLSEIDDLRSQIDGFTSFGRKPAQTEMRSSNLEEDYNKLMNANQKLFEDNEVLARELDELQSSTQGEIEGLRKELDRLAREKNTVKTKIDGGSDEIQRLKDKIILLMTENERLQRDIEPIGELKTPKNGVEGLSVENEGLNSEILDLKKRLQKTEGDLGKTRETLRQKEQELDSERRARAAADKKVNDFEREVKSLLSSEKAKEGEISRLKRELELAQKQRDDSEGRVRSLQQSADQLEKQIQDWKHENARLENEIKKRDKGISEKEADLQNMVEKIKELEADNKFIGATISGMGEEISHLKKEIVGLEDEIERFRLENGDLKTKLGVIGNENQSYLQDLNTITYRFENLGKENERLLRENENLQLNYRRIEDECRNLKLDIDNLRKEKQEAERERSSEVERARIEKIRLADELDRASRQKQQLELDNKNLDSLLKAEQSISENLKNDNGQLKSSLRSLEAESQSKAETIKRIELELEKLRKDLRDLTIENGRLSNELRDLEYKHSTLVQEAQTKENQHREREVEMGARSREVGTIKAKYSELEEENQNLKGEIKELDRILTNLEKELNDAKYVLGEESEKKKKLEQRINDLNDMNRRNVELEADNQRMKGIIDNEKRTNYE